MAPANQNRGTVGTNPNILSQLSAPTIADRFPNPFSQTQVKKRKMANNYKQNWFLNISRATSQDSIIMGGRSFFTGREGGTQIFYVNRLYLGSTNVCRKEVGGSSKK